MARIGGGLKLEGGWWREESGGRREEGFDGGELFLPVGTNFLGMQAHHRVEVVGVLLTERQNTSGSGKVDGGNENLFHPGLTCPFNHGITVFAKLLAIDVAMRVYNHNL